MQRPQNHIARGEKLEPWVLLAADAAVHAGAPDSPNDSVELIQPAHPDRQSVIETNRIARLKAAGRDDEQIAANEARLRQRHIVDEPVPPATVTPRHTGDEMQNGLLMSTRRCWYERRLSEPKIIFRKTIGRRPIRWCPMLRRFRNKKQFVMT